MSKPNAAAPAAPAVTPTSGQPQPPPAEPTNAGTPPETPETPPETDAAEDPLLRAVMRDMGVEVPETPIEAAPETPPTAGTPPEAPETPPATPKPAAKVSKKPAIPKGELDDIQRPTQTHKPEVAPKAMPPAEEAAYIVTLTEEQRDELHEAEVAERLFPDRHKGRRARLLAYFKQFDIEAKALLEKDPNRSLDETDEEFATLLAKKPTMPSADLKKVVREMGKEEATAAVKKDIQPKIDETDFKLRRLEVMPKVDSFVTKTFSKGIEQLVSNDEQSPISEAVKAISEKGEEAAIAEFPLEAKAYIANKKLAVDRARKYLLISQQAEKFNPSADEDHQYLANFINTQGQNMLKQPLKMLNRGGRQFLTREQFNVMLAEKKDEAATFNKWTTKSYWTFDDDAIIDMLAIQAKIDTERGVNWVIDQNKSYGFERQKKQNLTPPTNPARKPPEELRPPPARPSPINGSGAPKPAPPIDADSVMPVDNLTTTLFGPQKN